MRIRILFDYGAHDSCFWNDEPTDRENYGSLIDVDDLPLSNSTKMHDKGFMCRISNIAELGISSRPFALDDRTSRNLYSAR